MTCTLVETSNYTNHAITSPLKGCLNPLTPADGADDSKPDLWDTLCDTDNGRCWLSVYGSSVSIYSTLQLDYKPQQACTPIKSMDMR